VERLKKEMANSKGRHTMNDVYLPQDNHDHMVKKLERGGNVMCIKCHQQGHKSFQCMHVVKEDIKMDGKKINPIIKAFIMYTKSKKNNKCKNNHYILKKVYNYKVLANYLAPIRQRTHGSLWLCHMPCSFFWNLSLFENRKKVLNLHKFIIHTIFEKYDSYTKKFLKTNSIQ